MNDTSDPIVIADDFIVRSCHGIHDIDDDFIDTNVTLTSGEIYYPTFITPKYLIRKMREARERGDAVQGAFHWEIDMIIVDRLTPFNIRTAVQELLENKVLATACQTRPTKPDGY